MSHIVTESMVIQDLDALQAACSPESGLEFVRGQQTYRWYGRSVGDYPLPAGFTEADLGKCEHAIRVRGNSGAYEIGVVRRRDAEGNVLPGYQLSYDFWNGGYGLEKVAGKNCSTLKQLYALQGIKKTLGNKYRITGTQQLANGSMKVVLG